MHWYNVNDTPETCKCYIWKKLSVVHFLQCKKCRWAEYVGETKETLETRISQHLGYISRNEENKPPVRHFNLRGHSAADMKVLVLDKIHQSDAFYTKEREHLHIRNFDLVRKCLNGKTEEVMWLCKLQNFLKTLSHKPQGGKTGFMFFLVWNYNNLNFMLLLWLLSDEESIKLLKYITDIESMYIS